MRILQVNSVGIEVGGAERSIGMTSAILRERGHEVRVFSTSRCTERFTPDRMPRRVATDVIPAIDGPRPVRLARYTWFEPARRAFGRLIDEFQPDVVHFNTVSEFSPAMLWVDTRAPRVLTVHGPEEWTGSLLEWNFPSMADGGLSRVERIHLGYLRWVQRPHYLRNLRRFDRVLAPSRYYAEAAGNDLRMPVTVVPNGVEIPGAYPITDHQALLFVGRLEAVKGVNHLIAAFHRVARSHPGARLRIVGDGEHRAALEDLARRGDGADRIRFEGWRSPDEVQAALRESGMVVVPSVWPENHGLAALEALGVGRPLVVSRVGGLQYVIEHEVSGLVTEPGDVDGLFAALDRMLRDPALVDRLGAGAAERSGEFAVELHADRLEEIYRELVEGGATSTSGPGGAVAAMWRRGRALAPRLPLARGR